MAQRIEARDSLDDFPTPPWATRALMEHVLLLAHKSLGDHSCWEPACGRGHMAAVLEEHFAYVASSDIHDYGYGAARDFLYGPDEIDCVDWIITNPPFRLAEAFVQRSFKAARRGIAILARTVFLESVGRYDQLFRERPPTIFAPFVERVPMLKGRLKKSASTATAYAWFVWEKNSPSRGPTVIWIPPCRKELERAADYGPVDSRLTKD